MSSLGDWLSGLSVWQVILLVLVVLVLLALVSAAVTAVLVRLGLRTPFVVRRINLLRERVVGLVKQPITVMVLDEVTDVIQTGHYTRNISAALVENRAELIDLVAEKVRADPNARLASKLPGYDVVVHEVSETTLRVIVEMLGDPRMDELVADLLRNNIQQIKQAVRAKQQTDVPPPRPPDVPSRNLRL